MFEGGKHEKIAIKQKCRVPSGIKLLHWTRPKCLNSGESSLIVKKSTYHFPQDMPA